MRRKLLLVGLDWVRREDPPVSLATASIAAACASVADVRTLTLNVNNAKPFVGDELTELLHDAIAGEGEGSSSWLVGLGGYVWAEHLLGDTVKNIKLALGRETRIVLGGTQVTYAPGGTFLPARGPLHQRRRRGGSG